MRFSRPPKPRDLLLALILLTPSPALMAETARPSEGARCFARHYSAAHLASHPEQRVTRLSAAFVERKSSGETRLALTMERRGSHEVYHAQGSCQGKAALTCHLDFDAGRFTLTAQGGSLLLRLAPGGITFEGAQDLVFFSDTVGDDRAFRLDPTSGKTC